MDKVYLPAVVDAYCSYAFGFLHVSKQPKVGVPVLHNEALPFYSEKGLEVESVFTHSVKEFCGGETSPYRLYPRVTYYNLKCSHHGYRNMGRRPIDEIEEYLETVRKEGGEYTFCLSW